MMARTDNGTGWFTLHLIYGGPDARTKILMRHMPLLAELVKGRDWFFTDLKQTIGFISSPLLEIAVRQPPNENTVRNGLREWLKAMLEAGVLEIATEVNQPCVLLKEFFPYGTVPPFYVRALAQTSARSIKLLKLCAGATDIERVQRLLRLEMLKIYRCYLDDPRVRQATMLLQAELLERVARSHEAEDRSRARGLEDKDNQERFLSAYPKALRSRAILVGRLAHTQAVRLLGPNFDHTPTWEAALLRDLSRYTLQQDLKLQNTER